MNYQSNHKLRSITCLFQIHETIETINQLKTQREFMLSFARDPQGFINDWLQSQSRDLKVSPPHGLILILGNI